MRWLVPLPLLLFTLACPAEPTEPTAKSGPAMEAGKSEPAKVETKSEPAEPVQSPSGAAPGWFTQTVIPGATVVQPPRDAQIGAATSSSMVLELPAATTSEDCAATVRTKLEVDAGGSVEPAVPGEKGRLTLQGQAGDYSYTVVCGPGKDGQPTAFLSYTRGESGPRR